MSKYVVTMVLGAYAPREDLVAKRLETLISTLGDGTLDKMFVPNYEDFIETTYIDEKGKEHRILVHLAYKDDKDVIDVVIRDLDRRIKYKNFKIMKADRPEVRRIK